MIKDKYGNYFYESNDVCLICKKRFLAHSRKQKLCSPKCAGIFYTMNNSGINSKSSKYSYNRDYFNKIDTPQKAYWVGFILGDGYLRERPDYNLVIELKKIDAIILENFITQIGGNFKQIKLRKSNGREYYKATIRSVNIANDLIKIGIPAKNKTFEAKPISTLYPNAFYLGLFDADGHVSTYKKVNENKYNIIVQLSGTKEICEGFSKFLGYDGRYVYNSGKFFEFRKSCTIDYKKVFNKLYKYDIPCLERKKQIFEMYINESKK